MSASLGAESEQLAGIAHALVARYGPRVLSGPFAGMGYVEAAAGSALVPKLLGCYEQELHATWAQAFRRGYSRLINVGCGEGYYAVGFARRMPEVSAAAFDLDPAARRLCARLAALNGVAERVAVSGECRVEHLRPLAGPGTLLICDCEGGEIDLLQPEAAPGLAACDLVVELHDYLSPGLSAALIERFAPSHRIALIPSVERDPGLFDRILAGATLPADPHAAAPSASWTDAQKRLALAELRPAPMQWAVMSAAR